MVEAAGGSPGGQSFAAQIAEAFLETDDFFGRVRVASGNRAAGARMAALEVDFADAEAHNAALVLTVKLIFPERGQFPIRARPGVGHVDFERGAKALTRIGERQSGEPIADGLQRRGGNYRRSIRDGVVGKAFGRVTDQDLLLAI